MVCKATDTYHPIYAEAHTSQVNRELLHEP